AQVVVEERARRHLHQEADDGDADQPGGDAALFGEGAEEARPVAAVVFAVVNSHSLIRPGRHPGETGPDPPFVFTTAANPEQSPARRQRGLPYPIGPSSVLIPTIPRPGRQRTHDTTHTVIPPPRPGPGPDVPRRRARRAVPPRQAPALQILL